MEQNVEINSEVEEKSTKTSEVSTEAEEKSTAGSSAKQKSDYIIKKLLRSYYEHVQDCLQEDQIKPEYKVWLTTPAAYLTFVIATFTEGEMARAARMAMSEVKDVPLMWIGAVIRDWYENPKQEMLTLKEMAEKYGPMCFDPEDRMTVSEGYQAQTGFASE